MLLLVTGKTMNRKLRHSPFKAQRAIQIKKAFVGENELHLLAWICSTHFWEGSKFQYMHHFFSGSFCPKWSIIWQWIRSLELSGLQSLFTCIPQQHRPPLLHRIQEIWMRRTVLSPWCQRWLNPEACNSIMHLGDSEWRWTGREGVEGSSFHYSMNIFSLLDKSSLMQTS